MKFTGNFCVKRITPNLSVIFTVAFFQLVTVIFTAAVNTDRRTIESLRVSLIRGTASVLFAARQQNPVIFNIRTTEVFEFEHSFLKS